jgi:hypothetical protein
MAFTLTRDAWKKFKTDNNLSKSSAFNKADVGPHIDSLWKACEQYSREKGWKAFRPLVTKLTDLQKAFIKFIALKEAKEELTPAAKNQIQTWQKQLNDAVFALREHAATQENELREVDVNALDRQLNQAGIPI